MEGYFFNNFCMEINICGHQKMAKSESSSTSGTYGVVWWKIWKDLLAARACILWVRFDKINLNNTFEQLSSGILRVW